MAARGLLAGKVALITGGASGIGKAICELFTKEGARVAVADINKTQLLGATTNLQGDYGTFEVDVSQVSSVKSMLGDVQAQFSDVPSVVVNAAGITRDQYIVKISEEMFDQVIAVNLKGTFNVMQAATKLMMKHKIKPGSIVNISSISGKVGPAGQGNYAASKAGVIGLTKTASREFAPYGIRCNVVLPGFIDTPMVKTIPEARMKQYISMIPLGRVGQPYEIAEACLFLASDKSSYMTGTSIEVTGGF